MIIAEINYNLYFKLPTTYSTLQIYYYCDLLINYALYIILVVVLSYIAYCGVAKYIAYSGTVR